MKLYWPRCTYLDKDGKQDSISTYDSCTTLSDALKQVNLWKNHYRFNILDAHIDIYDHGERIDTINLNLNEERKMQTA